MHAAALLLTATLCGCVTTVSSSPPGAGEVVARVSRPTRAWNVTLVGDEVGLVVRFGSPPQGFLFVVRNAYGQDLGIVDSLGRAWRLRPPEGNPEFIGSGTVAEGTRRILGMGAGLVLRETVLPEQVTLPPALPPLPFFPGQPEPAANGA
jgi:hypothetical protein